MPEDRDRGPEMDRPHPTLDELERSYATLEAMEAAHATADLNAPTPPADKEMDSWPDQRQTLG